MYRDWEFSPVDLAGRLSNHDLAAAMRDLHTRISANGAIAKIGRGR